MTADHKPLTDQERAIAKIVARDALWDAPADKVARNAYFFTDEHRARWLLAEAIPRYEATVREAQERALFMEQQYRAIQDYLIRIATGRTLNAVETPIPIDPVIKDLSATVAARDAVIAEHRREVKAENARAEVAEGYFNETAHGLYSRIANLEAKLATKDGVIAEQRRRVQCAVEALNYLDREIGGTQIGEEGPMGRANVAGICRGAISKIEPGPGYFTQRERAEAAEARIADLEAKLAKK